MREWTWKILFDAASRQASNERAACLQPYRPMREDDDDGHDDADGFATSRFIVFPSVQSVRVCRSS